jgi:hypothetical protein
MPERTDKIVTLLELKNYFLGVKPKEVEKPKALPPKVRVKKDNEK